MGGAHSQGKGRDRGVCVHGSQKNSCIIRAAQLRHTTDARMRFRKVATCQPRRCCRAFGVWAIACHGSEVQQRVEIQSPGGWCVPEQDDPRRGYRRVLRFDVEGCHTRLASIGVGTFQRRVRLRRWFHPYPKLKIKAAMETRHSGRNSVNLVAVFSSRRPEDPRQPTAGLAESGPIK